eukprot:Clim_evm73s144 gene=Clim_evmTU73s144
MPVLAKRLIAEATGEGSLGVGPLVPKEDKSVLIGNENIASGDFVTVRIDETEPLGIARILRIIDSDRADGKVEANWVYRLEETEEICRKARETEPGSGNVLRASMTSMSSQSSRRPALIKQREVYVSVDTDLIPIGSIVCRVTVVHTATLNDLREYCRGERSFHYATSFDTARAEYRQVKPHHDLGPGPVKELVERLRKEEEEAEARELATAATATGTTGTAETAPAYAAMSPTAPTAEILAEQAALEPSVTGTGELKAEIARSPMRSPKPSAGPTSPLTTTHPAPVVELEATAPSSPSKVGVTATTTEAANPDDPDLLPTPMQAVSHLAKNDPTVVNSVWLWDDSGTHVENAARDDPTRQHRFFPKHVTRVGPEFQIECPKLRERQWASEADRRGTIGRKGRRRRKQYRGICVFSKQALEDMAPELGEDDLDAYVQTAKDLAGSAHANDSGRGLGMFRPWHVPLSNALGPRSELRVYDLAFGTLMANQGNVGKALTTLRKKLSRDVSDVLTLTEIEVVRSTVGSVGKKLWKVQQLYLPWRRTQQLVLYYYLSKYALSTAAGGLNRAHHFAMVDDDAQSKKGKYGTCSTCRRPLTDTDQDDQCRACCDYFAVYGQTRPLSIRGIVVDSRVWDTAQATARAKAGLTSDTRASMASLGVGRFSGPATREQTPAPKATGTEEAQYTAAGRRRRSVAKSAGFYATAEALAAGGFGATPTKKATKKVTEFAAAKREPAIPEDGGDGYNDQLDVPETKRRKKLVLKKKKLKKKKKKKEEEKQEAKGVEGEGEGEEPVPMGSSRRSRRRGGGVGGEELLALPDDFDEDVGMQHDLADDEDDDDDDGDFDAAAAEAMAAGGDATSEGEAMEDDLPEIHVEVNGGAAPAAAPPEPVIDDDEEDDDEDFDFDGAAGAIPLSEDENFESMSETEKEEIRGAGGGD